MGPRFGLGVLEENILPLLGLEPRFLGRLARTLVTKPTDLSPHYSGMKLAGTKEMRM
jgi:hypothetical protein